MSEKQTAIEWLVEKLKEQEYLGVFCTPDAWGREEEIMKGIVEQANKMFEQQTKEAWQHGFDWGMMEQSLAEQGHESTLIDANHYYKETFNK
jgi:hypothetical protein